MNRFRHRSRSNRQKGLTLIELLLALFVLAVGMAGSMILVSTAIASNNRNKLDTTSTLLAQMVLEKIVTSGNNNLPPLVGIPPAQGPPPHFVNVTDCTGATFPIYLDPGGPTLNAATGEIDFTAAVPPIGYSMLYTVCRAAGQTAVYEVRWNVTAVKASPNIIYTKLVTVAARPTGAGANNRQKIFFFGLPITLRGESGVSPN
jgi:prepilin-type N-terminal cleavage/methylation domain-containing protein